MNTTPFLIAVIAASLAWFFAAALLFFNPLVDKKYRREEGHAAVRPLPQSPKTIGKILVAIFVQTIVWAWVYTWVSASLPGEKIEKGLLFGAVLILTKMIPRDVDRLLLTTYPVGRMTIEFVIGCICSLVVGLVFAHWL